MTEDAKTGLVLGAAGRRSGNHRAPRRPVPRAPLLLAIPMAVLGGLALDAATPWLAWWPAALLGAALILAAGWQQGAGRGALLGALSGAAFWGPHIFWLTLYLGPIPWLALCAAMTAWFALFGAAQGAASRGLARWGGRPGVIPLLQALTAAGLWVTREHLQSVVPYGGFAWGRLAHTQADGPLAPVVSWVGFAGLSGLLAFASALAVALVWARVVGSGRRRLSTRVTVSGGALAIVGFLLLSLVPPAPLESTGTLRVGAIQGNSESGIFDDRESGDVLRDHLRATEAMLDDLERDGDRVDVIVWPENSAEFDLPGNPFARFAVQRLAERAGAPLVVGTILRDADGTYTNSSVVVDGEGVAPERYDKRRPVPFAEYMPDRAFYRSLVPELVDLVQLEYAFGQRPAAFEVRPEEHAPIVAGIAICFDVIFDDHAVAMQEAGAEVIFAQTNNADFGRTDESAQQLQIAQLRAIELGRSLVNISTVGTSAIVAPDGSRLGELTPFTSDYLVADVPLRTGETPALVLGGAIAAFWMILGIGGAAVAAWAATRARSSRDGANEE